ncbi:hypothetical protein RHSIM_Rhsim07G0027000 [Rhododendron simsii]|uniref:Pentatricopeptide repeat-containing protein n=1 Tax=Rhododendron simsii TaxID=118357 RepID=A0A834LJH9_RHOSS|nr:hypothetical protein RHSIM_Rhsim07G0027000 [Rhododendron simsii]
MATQEIYARREVYKALLRACSMTGDSEGAQRVFDAIQFAGIIPDVKLFGLLINAYLAGFEPSDKCIALILTAYETKNKLNKALDLLMELERDSIVVGKEALEVLVRWFRKLGVVEEVELVLREYASKQRYAFRSPEIGRFFYVLIVFSVTLLEVDATSAGRKGSAQPKTKKGHSKIWLAGDNYAFRIKFLGRFPVPSSSFSVFSIKSGTGNAHRGWKLEHFTWDKKGKPRLFATLVGYKDSKASSATKGPESEGSESQESEGLSSRGFCSINAMNVKRPTRNRI